MERRVVVTGMGAVTPLAMGVNELYDSLLKGNTSIRNVSDTHSWLKGYKVEIGSLFTDFDFDMGSVGLRKGVQKAFSSFAYYGLAAAAEALQDSGLQLDDPDVQENTGVCIGTGGGGLAETESQKEIIIQEGIEKAHRYGVCRIIADAASGIISLTYGFHATESPAVVSACASGASSIVSSYRSIKLGDADIMVSGGTEGIVGNTNNAILAYVGFGRPGAITEDFNDDPEHASRPFDEKRSGFVIGEGAGILILEELEHAKRRGAKIYAELAGYGVSSDGSSIMQPRDDVKYVSKALSKALKMANLTASQVQYVNAHGTSTLLNDMYESKAIRQVFGDSADSLVVNSTKSMLGHTLGAAGGLESIVTIKAINSGFIHPTRNLTVKGEGCDLDYAMDGDVREKDITHAISNSFGFFGHNVVLVFKKYE